MIEASRLLIINNMIARIWRSVTLVSQADYYLDILNKTVTLPCQSAEGNQGIYIFRELRGELAHFLLISLWESSEALYNYAGSENNHLNHTEEELEHLIASESLATDYELLVGREII